jgi:CheY-like chemotaxis protein/HPt (histidine-containing phosphotransfer) domain-containing protein
MNGVIGMIEVLEQTELAPDQAKMLGLARDSACSLMEIIEDILDFSKIEAGRIELERAPISVASIVERACGLVAGVAAGKGVELSICIDPRLPETIWGDAVRLRQVLVNLLSNAIKFSSGRVCAGRVGVSAVEASRGGDRVALELTVTDNGIGMDAATLGRLFKPFAQADASTTRRYGGTGLGLVICRHLVEAMGGRIRVHSTPEVGSRFTIELSAVVAPQRPDADDAGRAARATLGHRLVAKPVHRELILVAEDNPINRLVISEQLKLLGWPAEVVGSGREALACWRSGRYSLLLTDLQMPEMDGYDLTAAIRAEEGESTRLPIIALTANALKDEAKRCQAAGLDDYMTKPVPLAALEAMLEHWLRPPAPPPAPSAAEAPADARVLADLVGDDPAVLREFYVAFASSAAEAAILLARAVADGQLADAGAVAHRLKGSARSVGAAVLGEICAALEQAGIDADRRATEAALPLLRAEVDRLCAWVDAHWAEPADASAPATDS